MQTGSLYYIDLFAGAGGLSEGFVREGYVSIAHLEIDPKACDSLRICEIYRHLTMQYLFPDLPTIKPGETCNKYFIEMINTYLRIAGIRAKRTVLTQYEARGNREEDRNICRKTIRVRDNVKGQRLGCSELLKEHQFIRKGIRKQYGESDSVG